MDKKLSFNKKTERRLLRHRKIDINTNCWIWTGVNKAGGYGRLTVDGIRTQAHRFAAYLWLDFDLKSDLLVLHKRECSNTLCFNPKHLYIGTHKDNSSDMIALGHLSTGYCDKGHPIQSSYHDITRRNNIRKYCRRCREERVRRWRNKKKLKLEHETP